MSRLLHIQQYSFPQPARVSVAGRDRVKAGAAIRADVDDADTSVDHSPTGPYLKTEQAAEYLGLKKATLEFYRSRGGGPRFLKLGGTRAVRYLRADLDEWARRRRTFRSTADYNAAADE
jgi:predicted DNA-binding transcriptional regulator AlpA